MTKISQKTQKLPIFIYLAHDLNSNASSMYRIITEFGRSLTLKAGKTVSRFDNCL